MLLKPVFLYDEMDSSSSNMENIPISIEISFSVISKGPPFIEKMDEMFSRENPTNNAGGR